MDNENVSIKSVFLLILIIFIMLSVSFAIISTLNTGKIHKTKKNNQ